MSSLLSVIVTKDPCTSAVNFYKTDIKSAKTVLNGYDKGSAAFIETIADIDNAHFMTMYEMQAFVSQMMGMKFNYPPRDRLIAAKELARVLSAKQTELLPVPERVKTTDRVCLPGPIITPCKKGTKLAILLEMMTQGAFLSEMIAAIGQKEGGVLSSINYDLNKRKNFGYKITKVNGEDFYTLILPHTYQGPIIV